MTASLKFLLPFSLFFSAGNALKQYILPPMQAVTASRAVEQFTAPLSNTRTLLSFNYFGAERSNSALRAGTLVLLVILAIWISGICFILFSWIREWRRVRALVLSAEYRSSLDGIPVAMARGVSEPGVFGILRLVLLLPDRGDLHDCRRDLLI